VQALKPSHLAFLSKLSFPFFLFFPPPPRPDFSGGIYRLLQGFLIKV